MSDREKELKRLHDVAWNVGLTLEQILEQKKSPNILVDAVLHGLPRTPDNVTTLYKFIASATDLSASTRQELCWGILLPFLEKVWSEDEAEAFKEKHPLRDGHDPNFVNISAVENRVRKSGLLNEDPGPHLVSKECSWGLEYAIQVLRVALDGAEVNMDAAQQLNMSICQHWVVAVDGFNRTNLGDDSLLSRELRLVRICLMKFANTKQVRLAYPASFGAFHQLLM